MTKKVFKTLINSSKLTDQQKNIWLVFAGAADEQALSAIADAAQNNVDDLRFLTNNVISQVQVMKEFNNSEWESIVQVEKC